MRTSRVFVILCILCLLCFCCDAVQFHIFDSENPAIKPYIEDIKALLASVVAPVALFKATDFFSYTFLCTQRWGSTLHYLACDFTRVVKGGHDLEFLRAQMNGDTAAESLLRNATFRALAGALGEGAFKKGKKEVGTGKTGDRLVLTLTHDGKRAVTDRVCGHLHLMRNNGDARGHQDSRWWSLRVNIRARFGDTVDDATVNSLDPDERELIFLFNFAAPGQPPVVVVIASQYELGGVVMFPSLTSASSQGNLGEEARQFIRFGPGGKLTASDAHHFGSQPGNELALNMVFDVTVRGFTINDAFRNYMEVAAKAGFTTLYIPVAQPRAAVKNQPSLHGLTAAQKLAVILEVAQKLGIIKKGRLSGPHVDPAIEVSEMDAYPAEDSEGEYDDDESCGTSSSVESDEEEGGRSEPVSAVGIRGNTSSSSSAASAFRTPSASQVLSGAGSFAMSVLTSTVAATPRSFLPGSVPEHATVMALDAAAVLTQRVVSPKRKGKVPGANEDSGVAQGVSLDSQDGGEAGAHVGKDARQEPLGAQDDSDSASDAGGGRQDFGWLDEVMAMLDEE